jgi:hypothetical protein
MALVGIVSVVAAGGTMTGAAASAIPRLGRKIPISDHNTAGPASGNSGNGKFNKNSLSINSPNFLHGIQNIQNTTVSGTTPTQAAICKKKFRHCRITQRLIVDP